MHTPDPRGTFEVTPEEREALWEKLYGSTGFGIWQGNFRDMLTDREANALISDFVARKIRQRVKDPEVAEKLIPKNHGFGTRRVPLETNYYEVYNQPNVRLVDIKETPIERITPTGLGHDERRDSSSTSSSTPPASTPSPAASTASTSAAPTALQAEGQVEGRPEDLLGVQVEGFPNMFMVMGPHTALGNIPRSIEYNVEWVTGMIRHMREHGLTRAECRPEGVARLDRPREGAGRGPAVQRGRLLDDRHQPQRRGQDGADHRALQRQRAGVPGAVRCGGGGWVSGDEVRKLILNRKDALPLVSRYDSVTKSN